jgi:hypothetical protein
MSFDPEYEKRYRALLADRELCRDVVISSIRRPNMYVPLILGVAGFSIFFGSPVRGILFTFLVHGIVTLSWLAVEEILTRRRLGLW